MARNAAPPQTPKVDPTERVTSLLKGTKSLHAAKRQESARFLGRFGAQVDEALTSTVVERLLDMVDDRNNDVRGAALTALGWLNGSVPSSQRQQVGEAVLAQFGDRSEEVRSRAMGAANRLYSTLSVDQQALVIDGIIGPLRSKESGEWIPPLRSLPELGRQLAPEKFSDVIGRLIRSNGLGEAPPPGSWYALDALLKWIPTSALPRLMAYAIREADSAEDKRRLEAYRLFWKLIFRIEASALEQPLRRYLVGLEDPFPEIRISVGAGLESPLKRLPPPRRRLIVDELVSRLGEGKIQGEHLWSVARCVVGTSTEAHRAFLEIALELSHKERRMDSIEGTMILLELAKFDSKVLEPVGRERLFELLADPEPTLLPAYALLGGGMTLSDDELDRMERLLTQAAEIVPSHERQWYAGTLSNVRTRRARLKPKPAADWNADGSGLGSLLP